MRRLIHWASRAAADIDAIGPVWIERLNEAGLLERPSDFYALTRERLLEFERIADISADRMIESIDRSRGVGLRRALIGLSIPMASEGTAAKLCRAGFERLEEVADAGEEALQQVEDIGPKVAASLHEHLGRAREEIERLRERGVNLDVLEEDLPPKVAADAPLAGKTVVITGTLADPRSGEKVPRPAFERLCERAGADDRLVGVGQHRHADHRRQRRRDQDGQGREARRRGRRPGGDLAPADRRRRSLTGGMRRRTVVLLSLLGVVGVLLVAAVLLRTFGMDAQDYRVPSESDGPDRADRRPRHAQPGRLRRRRPRDRRHRHPPPAGGRRGRHRVRRHPPRVGQMCARPSEQRADVSFIKRVVAGPGDRIALRDGRVVRDGEPPTSRTSPTAAAARAATSRGRSRSPTATTSCSATTAARPTTAASGARCRSSGSSGRVEDCDVAEDRLLAAAMSEAPA